MWHCRDITSQTPSDGRARNETTIVPVVDGKQLKYRDRGVESSCKQKKTVVIA